MLERGMTYAVVGSPPQPDYPVHGAGCDEPVGTVVRRERAQRRPLLERDGELGRLPSRAWSRSP